MDHVQLCDTCYKRNEYVITNEIDPETKLPICRACAIAKHEATRDRSGWRIVGALALLAVSLAAFLLYGFLLATGTALPRGTGLLALALLAVDVWLGWSVREVWRAPAHR